MKVILEKYNGQYEDIHFIDDDDTEHLLVVTAGNILAAGGTEKYMKDKDEWIGVAEQILDLKNRS